MNIALNPWLYFRRNVGKSLPMVGVIAVAVVLVASVVSIVRSIDMTVFTLYGYNRYLTGITPRNALRVDSRELAKLRRLPELGHLYEAHSYQVAVKTIFGKMVFPVFGLEPEGRRLLLERCGVALSRGRLPEDGKPEAVVSEDIAQNLGLKIGDVMLRPDGEDNYAPIPVRLVGTLRGRVWLGLTSKELVDTHSPFTWSGYLAFSPTPDASQQARLDAAVQRAIDKGRARIWTFAGLVRETRSALANLYLILNIIVAILVISISFVCGLLTNIVFTQRLPEVATLAAIGYPRATLIRRAFGETSLLCLFGWLLGGALTVSLLGLVRAIFLTPRGLLLDPFDPLAYAFTVPLPFSIALFALLTISLRLARFDPVTIIERRG